MNAKSLIAALAVLAVAGAAHAESSSHLSNALRNTFKGMSDVTSNPSAYNLDQSSRGTKNDVKAIGTATADDAHDLLWVPTKNGYKDVKTFLTQDLGPSVSNTATNVGIAIEGLTSGISGKKEGAAGLVSGTGKDAKALSETDGAQSTNFTKNDNLGQSSQATAQLNSVQASDRSASATKAAVSHPVQTFERYKEERLKEVRRTAQNAVEDAQYYGIDSAKGEAALVKAGHFAAPNLSDEDAAALAMVLGFSKTTAEIQAGS